MGIEVHNIATGELENTLAGHLLNAANHPDHSAEEVLPFGFTHDHVLHDGTPAAGGMVPIPAWLIEGASKKILIDTGLGDLDELMTMMKSYGVDMFASGAEDQDLVTGLLRTVLRLRRSTSSF